MADSIDIIYGERVTRGVDVQAIDKIKGGALWLDTAEIERVSGWTLKPEGFCKGEACIPIPIARQAEFVSPDNKVGNLVALAATLGQPVVLDQEHGTWCFGEAAAERRRVLTSLVAPDFALPDLDGRMHSLSEHRGKKVLLVSWASW